MKKSLLALAALTAFAGVASAQSSVTLYGRVDLSLAKPIGEVHVQAAFPQVNTTVLNGAEYPTGFTRGATWFE